MPENVKLFAKMDPSIPNEEQNFFIKETHHTIVGDVATTPPLHRHPFFELIFVTEGRGIMQIDFQDHVIEKGSFYLLSPSQVHLPLIENDFHCFLLRFDLSIFSQTSFFDKLSIFHFDSLIVQEPDYSDVYSNLITLCEEFNQDRPFKQSTIHNLLTILLIKIQRLLPDVVTSKTETTIFSSLNQLMEENNYKMVTPSYYAKKLKISLKSLNEAVKKYTGQVCGEYIRSKTIIEAKRLLRYTTMSSSQITTELGFADTGYFSRFFKRETGLSPIEFRKTTL